MRSSAANPSHWSGMIYSQPLSRAAFTYTSHSGRDKIHSKAQRRLKVSHMGVLKDFVKLIPSVYAALYTASSDDVLFLNKRN